MYSLIVYLLILTIITIAIIITPVLLSIWIKKWSNKNSSFECGINLDSIPRKSFSIRFFLLMVLFVIFDVEIAIIIVRPIIRWSTQITIFFITFIIILIIGIIYEWIEGSLNWKL